MKTQSNWPLNTPCDWCKKSANVPLKAVFVVQQKPPVILHVKSVQTKTSNKKTYNDFEQFLNIA